VEISQAPSPLAASGDTTGPHRPRCRTTQLGGLRRSLARSGGAEGDVAPWLVSTSDAANSKYAANPGCFCSSNLRTYSIFSISCLVDFIDISNPIVVSRRHIPEPVIAGLAGGSAPGCESRCRRVGAPARYQPGVIRGRVGTVTRVALQTAGRARSSPGWSPGLRVRGSPGVRVPGTDVDRALLPSRARPEPAPQQSSPTARAPAGPDLANAGARPRCWPR
jgi:hypothetical protein